MINQEETSITRRKKSIGKTVKKSKISNSQKSKLLDNDESSLAATDSEYETYNSESYYSQKVLLI